MEKLIREMEVYQSHETENLRKIRGHRARKNTWRHVQRVKRIKGILGGLGILTIGIGILIMNHGGDATYMIIIAPIAIYCIINGAD